MALASGAIAAEHGFYEPPLTVLLLRLGLVVAVVLHVVLTVGETLRSRDRGAKVRGLALFGALLLGLLLTVGGEPVGWRLVEGAIITRLFADLWALSVVLSRRFARPEAIFPLSFVLLILIGTLLLKLPKAVAPGSGIGWIDALFTSTSAVCVTGLTVRSTAHEFTPVGQAIIGLLIQLGGLGIIMFGSTLMMMLGRSLSARENLSLSQMLSDQPVNRLLGYGRFVLTTTILIEVVGALLMYPLWEAGHGEVLTAQRRMWLSAFHSVSAFCNAGFDITGESMMPYRGSALTHGVIAPLIVLGGLGFPVLHNAMRIVRVRIHRRRRHGRSPLPRGYAVADSRLSLHSRLAIATTAWLYLYGVLVIALAQGMPMLERLGPHEGRSFGGVAGVLADASFMSITARTAGFNSLPMEELESGSVFALMTLMIIGGSPGSTAGGMKTTTLAVLVLSVAATIRRRKEAEAFGRTIADTVVRKAGTLGVCYFGLIVGCTVALALVEPAHLGLEPLLFEAISAATTTGLSLGITADLSPVGKLVIVAAMFLGRVGPLALLTVLIFGRGKDRPYTYAHEGVALG